MQRKTISPHFFPSYKIKQDFSSLNPFYLLGTETLSESIFLILGIVSQVRVSWDAAHQNIREFIPYCKYDWIVQNAFWAIKDVSKLNYSLGRPEGRETHLAHQVFLTFKKDFTILKFAPHHLDNLRLSDSIKKN